MKVNGDEKGEIYDELFEYALDEDVESFFEKFPRIFSPKDAVEYEEYRQEFERQMRRDWELDEIIVSTDDGNR